uniref:G-protein coupled receptors family 1 profile domain-containing protein n=1 Tax=Plectus sambesii TaxID=2011161 RepID=A0A914X5C6_9BILA
MMSIGSLLVGGLLGVASLCAFFLNIFVLIVMIKGGFLASGSNVMYLMAFNLLVSDTFQLSVHLLYQAPAAVLQEDIHPPVDIDLSRVGGFISLWMWNNGGIMLTLLSLNRLVQICYPEFAWMFSRNKTTLLCAAVWPCCLLLTIISQYILPCCEFVVSYSVYSYAYRAMPNTTNYSLKFVDTPSNFLCTIAVLINYSVIFYKVRTTRHNLLSGLSEIQHTKRRQKEYRFALQFLLISSFYTIGWISVRIYPLIIPLDQPKWFSILAITSVVNSSINSLIYVYYNPDINKACRKLIGATVSNSSSYSAVNAIIQERETTQ